jgi:uncharacterized membrane protein (DUF485 family)
MSASPPVGHTKTGDPPSAGGNGDAPAAPAVHWSRIAATPEFQELHASRRRYTLWGTAVATLVLLIGFGLYGFAPDALGEPAVGSLTWALVVGLALVAFTFVMAWTYTRKARHWDRMATRVLDSVERADDRAAAPAERFAR